MTKSVPMPLSVEVDGRTWNLFSFRWTSPDGEFSTYFYALSQDHAMMMIEEIKETAVFDGQVVEVIE